ncbi:MAG TPA: hypothetical protein HPP83_10735 [Candidatus Hydrogenedentes bacterium]|nr:hypothetical protein [Candidatus Hydrogenedentota bacterium]
MSKGQYVAWIDILGIGDLMASADTAKARNLWIQYRDAVRDEFTGIGSEVCVWGVNDGFYARAANLAQLAERAIALYRRWFDAQVKYPDGRPLLRGAIIEAPKDIVDGVGDHSCIKQWLLGPGFGTAYEYEQLLRGGRLFMRDTLAGRAGFSDGMEYPWRGLAEWDNLRPKQNLLEILWPLDMEEGTFAARFDQVAELYRKELEHHLEVSGNPPSRKSMRRIMQYEETLKLHLRTAGVFLQRCPDRRKCILPLIERYLAYRPNTCHYTWGLTFVALESLFRSGDHACDKHFRKALKFLNSPVQDGRERIHDFREELKRPTYESFRKWLEQKCPLLVS